VKLCVVGNSHAGALKSALAVGEAAGEQVDFFVMPGGSGPHLHAEGGRLFPVPSRKDKVFSTLPGATAEGLDLYGFDAVMISAAGLPSHRNGDASHILNQLALGSLAHDLKANQQAVSEAVMTSAMESVLHASPNLEAIRLVRSVFPGQLIIQVCPLPTRAIAAYKVEGERGSNLAAQYGDKVWQFLSWYYRTQISIIRAYADTLGAHIIAPDDSFLEAGQTPSRYGTPDPWHMNTAYGRLVLKQALAPISSA
jgi:hypothetical protein